MIEIWCIGNAHDKNLSHAINDYTNRINNFIKIGWTILDNYKSDNKSVVIRREGKLIYDKLPQNAFIIVLDRVQGKEISSVQLAEKLEFVISGGQRKIIFIIGGAFGIDNEVINKSNFIISFSPLTFPHQIVRLILVEQIYRAFTIIKKLPYHW